MGKTLQNIVLGTIGTVMLASALARVPYVQENVCKPIKQYIQEACRQITEPFSLENIFRNAYKK